MKDSAKRSLLSTLRSRPPGTRIVLSLAITGLHALLFGLLYRWMPSFPLLSSVPVIIVATMFGLWGGIVAALLILPVNLLMLWVVGAYTPALLSSGIFWIGHVLVLAIGMTVGYLGTVQTRLAQELISRRRVQEAMRESEEKYRLMVETSPDPVFQLDIDGTVRYCSRAVERVLGIPAEEVMGSEFVRYFTPADLSQAMDDFRRLSSGQLIEGLEVQVLTRDGSLAYLDVNGVPLFRDGQVIGIQGVARDITERRRAVEALRRERDFAESLIDTAQVVVLVLDPEGRIVRFNPYLEQISGYRLEDIRDQDWFEIFLPERDRQRVRSTFQEAIRETRTQGNINAIVTKDGREVAIEWYDKTLKDDAGNVVGLLTVGLDISVRQQAVEALQESEERYRTLVMNQGEGIALVTVGAKFAFVNPAAEDIFGTPRNELVGKSLADFITPEAFERIRAQTEARQAGVASTYETVITRPDGETRHLLITATPQFDAAGQFVGTFGVFRDITARVRAETEIARLAAVIDQATETVVITDLDGNIVYANPYFEASTGYSLEEALGENPRILKSGHQDETFYQQLWDTIAAGQTWEGVFINKRKGGECYHEEASIFPIQNAAGEIINYAAVKRDVTKRVRAEEALKEYSERLEEMVDERTAEVRTQYARMEAILQSVGDAIMLVDTEERIVYVNTAFSELTGYQSEEVLGDPASSVGVALTSEQDLQSLRRALSEGSVWHGEGVVQRKDGREYDAALIAAPMWDADGDMAGFVSSHRDISRLKDLDRARNQFITNVSHQLRTPVATVELYLHLLEREQLEGAPAEHLEAVKGEIARLAKLIQGILEMTLIDSGKAIGEWEPFSLPHLIRDTVSHYQDQATESDLSLGALPMPKDLPAVSGDYARLAQALGEVVENAVIYTSAGGEVTLTTEVVEYKDRTWVTLSVRDTGPGISAQDQERVFDRFFRGKPAESGHIPGTGLGLSIAQEILRAHGGRITIESAEGQGSIFTLWLPVVGSKEA